jgi:hypothetical protein
MGITIGPNFTTDSGITLSSLYITISSMRYTVTANGDLHSVFTVQAYKSREDKMAGRAPISLPQNLTFFDTFLNKNVLQNGNLYTLAYEATKARFGLSGFQVTDVMDVNPAILAAQAAAAQAALAAAEAEKEAAVAAAEAAHLAAQAAHAAADAAPSDESLAVAAEAADAVAMADDEIVAEDEAKVEADIVALEEAEAALLESENAETS